MERGSVVESVFRQRASARATEPTGMYSHGLSGRLKREKSLTHGRNEWKRAREDGDTEEQRQHRRMDDDLMKELRNWELERLQRFAYQLQQMISDKQDALRPVSIPQWKLDA